MIVVYPFPPASPSRLDELVVAYVNERGPSRGQASLRSQILAVQGRAKRDGVAIGLLVIEPGGRVTAEGRGHRLAAVIEAAGHDDFERVLYVAGTDVLGSGPQAVLGAMRAVFAAGFQLREPCGMIAPSGRRVKTLVASISKPSFGGKTDQVRSMRPHPARETSHPQAVPSSTRTCHDKSRPHGTQAVRSHGNARNATVLL